MHDPTTSVRFGCLLEALCRGSGAYLRALSREVVALGKLKDLSELVVRGDQNKVMCPARFISNTNTKWSIFTL